MGCETQTLETDTYSSLKIESNYRQKGKEKDEKRRERGKEEDCGSEGVNVLRELF